MKKNNLRSHFHCVYELSYHLVLVTKYRKKCLNSEMIKSLEKIFYTLCQKWDVTLKEFGGEKDHVHLLIQTHPAMQMSVFVNNIKTVSSRYLRRDYSAELEQYYWKPVLWSRAYFLLTCGGAPLEKIKDYIQNQGNEKSSRRRPTNSSPPKG